MSNKIYRLGWGVAAVFALLFAASMSGIVQGGALDPPGAPGSTMKSLDDIPGSWSRELSATGGCSSPRFDCVFAGDVAVLDRETGLVWERIPSETTQIWANALTNCSMLFLGGKYGWRLPRVDEINSLFGAPVAGADLPAGHPFTVNSAELYWTATTFPSAPTLAWGSVPGSADIGAHAKTTNFRKWCVRGGQGLEGQ